MEAALGEETVASRLRVIVETRDLQGDAVTDIGFY